MQYKKLVRDKIPEIIKAEGKIPVTRIADEKEYIEKLREKLSEEVKEFLESEKVEELADVLEVVYAILESKGASKEDLEKIRKEKADKRGSFKKRIILESA